MLARPSPSAFCLLPSVVHMKTTMLDQKREYIYVYIIDEFVVQASPTQRNNEEKVGRGGEAGRRGEKKPERQERAMVAQRRA